MTAGADNDVRQRHSLDDRIDCERADGKEGRPAVKHEVIVVTGAANGRGKGKRPINRSPPTDRTICSTQSPAITVPTEFSTIVRDRRAGNGGCRPIEFRFSRVLRPAWRGFACGRFFGERPLRPRMLPRLPVRMMSEKIEDYALIGDCHTTALVGRDGSIDWLCLPRFDSPACFAALLGTAEHGRRLLRPADNIRPVTRHYRDDTLVLETDYRTSDSAVTVIDCMPPRTESPNLLRMVVGRRGRVAMKMQLVIRFDYGSILPWCARSEAESVLWRGPIACCFVPACPCSERTLRPLPISPFPPASTSLLFSRGIRITSRPPQMSADDALFMPRSANRSDETEPLRRLPVGAEVVTGGGVHFRVWADANQRVEVVLGRQAWSLCLTARLWRRDDSLAS